MNIKQSKDPIVLTGDRPTGPLHLGHYVGSLANRLRLQEQYEQFIMIADVQALTDHYKRAGEIPHNVFNVVLDYLSVGIDPEKSTIFIQSLIPELFELTTYYLNLVTVSRLERNPTVKTEIKQKGMERQVPTGFFIYPISQAADITFIKARYVPVGEDQLPMIELTNEIVRSFNRIYQSDVLCEAEAIIPKVARLPGIDGREKMGKTMGNAIFLSDDSQTVKEKVMRMYTDPHHVRVEDPGTVEGNTVFTYLDVFDPDHEKVHELKEHYRLGGLGDVAVKKYLYEVLENFLAPIRERRAYYEQRTDYIHAILREGTEKTRAHAQETMREVREAMGFIY